MNEQEVINELHRMKKRLSGAQGCSIKTQEANQYSGGCLRMAISALGKQIARIVRFEDAGYNRFQNVNVYSCRCPSCGLDIIVFDDNDISCDCDFEGDAEKMFHSSMTQGPEGMNSYCNRCGQKLDWGD